MIKFTMAGIMESMKAREAKIARHDLSELKVDLSELKARDNMTTSESKEIKVMHRIPLSFNGWLMTNHLRIWINSTGVNEKYLEENVDISFDYSTISFYKAEEAQKFMDWWEKYTNLFGSEAEVKKRPFPALSDGEISGFICITKNDDDDMKASSGSSGSSVRSGSASLPGIKSRGASSNGIKSRAKIILDNLAIGDRGDKRARDAGDWAWIVANTTKGAKYIDVGWVFENQTDFTMFKMLQK